MLGIVCERLLHIAIEIAWTARHSDFVLPHLSENKCIVSSIAFHVFLYDNQMFFNYHLMDHIFTVLPGVLRKRGLQEHAEGALIVLRAQKWIGARLPHLETVI